MTCEFCGNETEDDVCNSCLALMELYYLNEVQSRESKRRDMEIREQAELEYYLEYLDNDEE